MLKQAPIARSLGFALLASAAAFAQTATAREAAGFAQAEWAQDYASPATMQVQRSSTPILSPQTMAATEQMVERYKDIVARGGWRPVSGADRLRVGAKGPAVAALRARLAVTGDIDSASGSSGVYDSYVAAAVKRFQARHGLSQTGSMSMATQQAMNVSADIRLKQLEVNAVRLRSYAGNLGNRFVITNIPRRPGPDGREWPSGDLARRRRRQDRPSVADHEYQGDADQFQSLLDGSGFHREEGPHPQDAEGSELPHRE